MRTTYFSPQPHYYQFQQLGNASSKLRSVGSTGKLQQHLSGYLLQSQRHIQKYSYSIHNQIGSGYSSKVYLGKNQNTQKQCAIKVIDIKKFSESSLKLLENQIMILKKIDHPNIMKCYDIFRTHQYCYIVSQYCSGGDLMTYMTKKGKIQQKNALNIMHDIVNGVKYLLKNGIIHRDIKPANILYDKKVWKIADFGFAMLSLQETKTKYNVGTPLYMPIQSLINNVYSPESDIFSVGIVFYELLTGSTPWQCKNEKDLIKKMKIVPYNLSQKYKISSKIRNLLAQLCSLQKDKRMNKQQFLNLQLLADNNNEMQKKSIKNSLIIQKNSISTEDIYPNSNSGSFIGSSMISYNKILNSGILMNTKISQKDNINYKSSKTILYNSQNITNIRKQPKLTNNTLKKDSSSKILYKSIRKSDQSCKKNISNSPSKVNCPQQNIQSNECKLKTNKSYFKIQPKIKLVIKQKKNQIQFLEPDTQKKNYYLLVSQIHFCRFIYYLIKNISYVPCNIKTRQKLKIILVKHLIKLIRNIGDSKNWFKLKNWQNFKLSKKYTNLLLTIRQYQSRYEKQYLNCMKSSTNLKQNQHNTQIIPQFFSQTYYKSLITIINPIIRQSNHNLALKLLEMESGINHQIKQHYQGLKNLVKYFELLELSLSNFEDYQYFENKSNIKVQVDYKLVQGNIQQYKQLREQLRFL